MKSWKITRLLLTALSALTLVSATQANANQYSDGYGYGYNNNNCCCDPCANDCGCGCGKFRAYADYLYWQISQEGMDYAGVLPGGLAPIVEAFINADTTPVTVDLTLGTHDQRFDWKSGFRVGAGYTTQTCRSLDLSWVHFNTKTNTTVADPNGGVIPTAFPLVTIADIFLEAFGGEIPTFATAGSSHWKFDFNVVDLELGKALHFCNCVLFRPYVGVKFASIRQKQNIAFSGLDIVTPGVTSVSIPILLFNNRTNDFRAVGPSFGFDSSWGIFQDFNLTSGFCTALMYGKFDVHSKPTAIFGGDTVTINLSANRKDRLIPMIGGNIGVDYDATFCDSFEVKLGVGYEAQYWWSQWRATHTLAGELFSGSSKSRGDLFLQGLTVRLGVGF